MALDLSCNDRPFCTQGKGVFDQRRVDHLVLIKGGSGIDFPTKVYLLWLGGIL